MSSAAARRRHGLGWCKGQVSLDDVAWAERRWHYWMEKLSPVAALGAVLIYGFMAVSQ